MSHKRINITLIFSLSKLNNIFERRQTTRTIIVFKIYLSPLLREYYPQFCYTLLLYVIVTAGHYKE